MKALAELNQLIDRYPKIEEIVRTCPYEILKEFHIESFGKGNFYLQQQTVYDDVYIVVDGQVSIFIENDNGRKVTLDTYTSGNFIGEHEAIQKIPYSSSVQSLSEVVLLRLPRDSFLAWLDCDLVISRRLIDSLCQQIYKLSGLTESYSLLSTEAQVISLLLKLGDSRNHIERNQLLPQISSTPRSIDRILKKLKDEKIINNNNGVIKVLEFEALQNYGGDV